MVVIPLIQKQTLDLPPALAVASLTLFGVLFGVVGVAVATPLVIVIRQAVLHFRQFSSEPAMDESGKSRSLAEHALNE
jgi:predicted PurR-regulated permease PerM